MFTFVGKGIVSMLIEKSRIKNLSTRYLSLYRYGTALLMFVLFGSYLYYQILEYLEKKHLSSLLMPLNFTYLIYVWFLVNKKVYHAEFDDEFMYVTQKGHDLVIPLENIKGVNLISVGGVYRVDLYAIELFGDKFYFKPSLLYPFNHKKKEAVINILWANIEKAKSKKQYFQRNALHS